MPNETDQLDHQIAKTKTEIAMLQGKLQGLEFAKGLQGRNREGEKDKTPSSRRSSELTPVRVLAKQAIYDSVKPLGYTEVVSETQKLAKEPINPKTVSSALDSLKKSGEVLHEDGKYGKPGTAAL